jgi:hypothetical protein
VDDLRSSLSLASVWANVVRASENFESWVSLYAVALAQIRLLSAVDLGQLDVLLLQRRCGLLVFWGEGLAVTAPWCED